MLSTPHVIVGVAIATKVAPPWASIPLAFASHFVLDMIPHWNPHLNTEIRTYGKITKKTKNLIYADTIAALVFLGVSMASVGITSSQALVLGLAGIAAITPDLLEAPYFFFHIKHPLLMAWLKFQKSIQSDAEVLVGVGTQIVVVLAALFWMAS